MSSGRHRLRYPRKLIQKHRSPSRNNAFFLESHWERSKDSFVAVLICLEFIYIELCVRNKSIYDTHRRHCNNTPLSCNTSMTTSMNCTVLLLKKKRERERERERDRKKREWKETWDKKRGKGRKEGKEWKNREKRIFASRVRYYRARIYEEIFLT